MSKQKHFNRSILKKYLNKIPRQRLYNRFEYIYPNSFFEFWTYYQFLNTSTFYLSSFNINHDIINETALYKCYDFVDENITVEESNDIDSDTDLDIDEITTIDEITSIDLKHFDNFLQENIEETSEETNDEEVEDDVKEENNDITFMNVDTLMYTTLSFNNIFVNLTNINGTSQSIKNCGLIGLKGPKKRTRVAIQETITTACKKISGTMQSDIFLFLRGFNINRRIVFETLLNLNKVNIVQIVDQTNRAHNGCKPKKKRRV